MESVDGSSTTSKVLVRNGGGPISCNPSIGFGVRFEPEEEDEELHDVEPTTLTYANVSSSFTLIPFIELVDAAF